MQSRSFLTPVAVATCAHDDSLPRGGAVVLIGRRDFLPWALVVGA